MAGRRNKAALSAAILSLFVWLPLLNYPIGAVAAYLGFRALREIREKPSSGKYLALLGIVLGALPFYLGLLNTARIAFGLDRETTTALGISVSVILFAVVVVVLRRTKLL